MILLKNSVVFISNISMRYFFPLMFYSRQKKGKIPLKYSPLNGKQSSYCLVPYHHERVESSSSFAVFDDDVASAADNSAACN